MKYIMALAGCALLLAGCSGKSTTGPTGNDTASVALTFKLQTLMGTKGFAIDTAGLTDNNIPYKVSKFRFYMSELRLVTETGDTVACQPVASDTASTPLAYGLTLVDYTIPASQTLRVLTKRGAYKQLLFTIGVPKAWNHVDASAMNYPLNVDADMYWSWNPGYIFLKIEGSSQTATGWESYLFHIGGDALAMPVVLKNKTITVASDGKSQVNLVVNVNKLFVTPSGQYNPDLGGADRFVQGGPTATIVSDNVVSSGFVSLQ